MKLLPAVDNLTSMNASFMAPFSLTHLSLATVRNATTAEACQMAFYTLLGCLVCCGNLLTIIAVYRTHELRTTPNMYVVSLACADFLSGVTFPFYMSSNLPFVVDVLNRYMIYCALRYGILYLFISESFFCILAIALDRYVYIMHPLRYYVYLNPKRTGFIIFITWCISIAIGACVYFTSTMSRRCSFFHVVSRSFQLYFIAPYMLTIFLLVAILYGAITRQAIRQRRRIRACNSPGPSLLFRYKSTFKSLRLFVIVYAVFVLCWFPSGLVVILGFTIGVNSLATAICLSLGLFNSGMNFVVYALMNRDFRRAFFSIFCRLFIFCRTVIV